MSWPNVPFGKVCKLVNGKAYKPTDWSNKGLPIIRIQNLNDHEKTFNYWDGPLKSQVLVKNFDVLLAWSGTPGTSFGTHLWTRGDAVLNQHIFRVDLDSKAIAKRWAIFAVNKQLYKLIEQSHGGVGLQHVTKGMVESLEIPLPPLPEQKRIAAILDKADAIRRKRQQAIKLADDFLRATFLDMFGDPVTNPKGWTAYSLKKVGKVSTGSTPPSSMDGMFGGEIPFITPGDLENAGKEIKRFVTQDGSNKSRTVRQGSTLVCCIGATIGKVGMAKSFAAFNQQINAVEWLENIDDFYGYWAMRFLKELVIKKAISTTLPILKKSEFESIAIPVPPKNLQCQFAKIVVHTSISLGREKKSESEGQQLFNSITQRAFRGEL